MTWSISNPLLENVPLNCEPGRGGKGGRHKKNIKKRSCPSPWIAMECTLTCGKEGSFMSLCKRTVSIRKICTNNAKNNFYIEM